MSNASKAGVKVIFGTMTIGKPGHPMTRVHTLDEAKVMVDTFQKYGHDTLDTALVYGEGSSEEYLGSLNLASRGIKIDSKLYPTAVRPGLTEYPYHHSPEDLRRGLMSSLSRLNTKKLTTWYLHGPDRTVPFEETLREVDKLYREGHFERYGLCNFQSWEVAKICEICERHGWVRPAVYQGLYNALHRVVEAELFPCLRHYGLSFYCFNPLAAGLLTSRYTRETTEVEKGSRFDQNNALGKHHADRYFHSLYFDALDILRPIAKKHGLTEVECALRWMSYHSRLKKENGDGIVIGASSLAQLEENLKALEGGPLPGEVVQALDAGWQGIRGKELKYWH
ncbi:NADP-dependent oxidoreductase domain-containing protein [Hypoxylon rubiginosum]|uniref:NADP-dependent oxidoreductase domain-containing protein n=1 Tax=Hypoxylon rubiginosum TaxID=110542 RepID=A0ACB9ZF24_9PEZI|nr:NADP-dependent oxidoreductase domain-containing protein [Hypoxylon rubiginosum]